MFYYYNFFSFILFILMYLMKESTAVKRRWLIHILFNIIIISDKLECRQPDSEANTYRSLEQ